MKKGKGKVLGASQIALFGMVAILCAAIWLNTKYSGKLSLPKQKYMGETTLVSEDESEDALPTAAEVKEDYFTKAAAERDQAYKKAEETASEILNTAQEGSAEVTDAANTLSALAKRKVDEVQIENILTAKGFSKCLVIISDNGVTVVVKDDGLDAGETVQIQDAVTNQCGVSLNNIKIVTVEG